MSITADPLFVRAEIDWRYHRDEHRAADVGPTLGLHHLPGASQLRTAVTRLARQTHLTSWARRGQLDATTYGADGLHGTGAC